MNQPSFQVPVWYHAATLTERIFSLRTAREPAASVMVDADLALRRVGRWRAQPPFLTDSYFAQRLASDGLAEDEFLHLLGEPVDALQDRFPTPPTWLMELDQAFTHFTPSATRAAEVQEELRGHEEFSFLVAIEPLIRHGRDRVREGIRELARTRSELPFDPGTVEGVLAENLPERLLALSARTLVLELNVARLQGRLSGDTPQARFQSFLEQLRQRDAALAFLQEYPVLARQLMICVEQWVAVTLEFLRRLSDDWEAIRETFSPGSDPGVLAQAVGGMGDAHRDGRSVLVASFSSGFKVVYKPRAMAVDLHFQELLAWLNDHGAPHPFRTLTVLDRGSYGWVEFVAKQDCTSPAEAQRFYERQGGYLALLYALEATDFHAENLIAAGEHPVMVDVESLFHSRAEGGDTTQAGMLAIQAMAHSVLRVGLLPQRIWANAASEGVDVSGLGTLEGQLTPNGVPYWEGPGTDEMRLDRKRQALPGSHNRPALNGVEISVLDYKEALAEGFAGMYRLLLRMRDELLSDRGPLARFAADEVRVILRPTMTYGILLQEATHPDLLRNALDRDRFIDRLWAEVERSPYLARVIPAERADLHRNDIPCFTTRPDSRDLWTSAGERIPDFFSQSGLALVRQRLQQFGEDDLARQLWFVRASLVTLLRDFDQAPGYRLAAPRRPAERQRLLTASRSVGDRLGELALRNEREAAWVGLTSSRKGHLSLLPLGIDLYDGLSGVALFLAYLGALTREERYTDLARATLTTLRFYLERSRSSVTGIGGFEGWGGVIYTLTHLGVLWDQPALLGEAQAVVERLPALIEQDESFDVIAGAAGCIGGLTVLHRCAPSAHTLAAAIQCGDRLLARARPMEHGIGWVTPAAESEPLAGFSHGAAGIAWALTELAALSGEERFRAAAGAAIAYERSLFPAEDGNWPDLRPLEEARPEGEENGLFVTWCYGASGIGLARLRSLPLLDDPALRAEIDAALQTTLAHGFGNNHSLCHGDLGNLELLMQAGQVLDEPRWRARVDHFAAVILESISRHGWLCGIPSGVESPGLMTGLAGIGYGLLRLAEPAHVPSVLTLAPPPYAA